MFDDLYNRLGQSKDAVIGVVTARLSAAASTLTATSGAAGVLDTKGYSSWMIDKLKTDEAALIGGLLTALITMGVSIYFQRRDSRNKAAAAAAEKAAADAEIVLRREELKRVADQRRQDNAEWRMRMKAQYKAEELREVLGTDWGALDTTEVA